jgi:hypothetical protein
MATGDPSSVINLPVQRDSIELQTLDHDAIGIASILEPDLLSGHPASELPAYDRGRGAWGYLAGAFIVEALCWGQSFTSHSAMPTSVPTHAHLTGFPFSFGIFQKYYSTHPSFRGEKFISAIGTAGSGATYLEAIFVMRFISRYPKHRKALMYIGLSVCSISCLTASFCSKVSSLKIRCHDQWFT